MQARLYFVAILASLSLTPSAQAGVTHLRVGQRPVSFVSRQTYRPKDVIAFRMRSHGHKLTWEQVDPYVLRFYGEGLAVRVETPRHGRGHVRIRAIGVESPRTLAVRFWIER